MTAKLQWRLRSIFASGQIGMNEIEMASEAGGPNLCVGGTAITDTSYGGYYGPDKAFNGNYTPGPGEWAGSYSFGYIGYAFPAAVEINELRIVTFSDPSLTPRLMLLESSDDGVAWTREWLIRTEAIASYPTVHVIPRPLGGARRFWGALNDVGRGDLSGNNFRDTVIADMQMKSAIGGSDLTAPGGFSNMVPISNGYSAAAAFDNDDTSITYTGASTSSLIYYDFAAPTIINEMLFTGVAGTNFDRAPGAGVFVSSDDSISWYLATAYGPLVYNGLVSSTVIDAGGEKGVGRRQLFIY